VHATHSTGVISMNNYNKICFVDLAGSERNKRTDNAGQLL